MACGASRSGPPHCPRRQHRSGKRRPPSAFLANEEPPPAAGQGMDPVIVVNRHGGFNPSLESVDGGALVTLERYERATIGIFKTGVVRFHEG